MRLYEHLTVTPNGEQSTAVLCDFCHDAVTKGCELYLERGEKLLGFENLTNGESCAFCGEDKEL